MGSWKYELPSGMPFGVDRGPGKALLVRLSAKWTAQSNAMAEYLGAEVRADLSELSIQWNGFFQPAPPQLVGANGGASANITIALPWDRDFVRDVENARARRPGDFTLRLSLVTHYKRVAAAQKMGDLDVYLAGAPLSDHDTDLRIPVSRDQWLQALRQMGHDEFAVFEVAVRRAPTHPTFADGMALLTEAQAAFHNGDWDGTVVKSRKACEAAVAMHGAADGEPEVNMKVAFAALGSRLFPKEIDEPRRKMLSLLFEAAAELRHMGAHARDPRVQVHREEAELALTTVIAIFRYVGHRLAGDRA